MMIFRTGCLGLLALLSFAVIAQEERPYDFALPTPKAGENWQPGVDYIVLVGGGGKGGYVASATGLDRVPLQTEPGKVVVTFFFQYTWGPLLELAIKKWAESRPQVQFVQRPSIGWIHTRLHARMYYTLKALGQDDLHFKFYEWVSKRERYRIYHGDPVWPDEAGMTQLNIEFARANGISESVFMNAYTSREVLYATNIAAAESHVAGSGGNGGDGSIVVNGKYATSAVRVCHRDIEAGKWPDVNTRACVAEQARLIKLLNYLVDDELEKARHSRK